MPAVDWNWISSVSSALIDGPRKAHELGKSWFISNQSVDPSTNKMSDKFVLKYYRSQQRKIIRFAMKSNYLFNIIELLTPCR